MHLGVPLERSPGESRVALSPEGVKEAATLGVTVVVETGAGKRALYTDQQYQDAGATVAPSAAHLYESADFVLRVGTPTPEEACSLREGSALAAWLAPQANLTVVKNLRGRRVTSFAMDLMPRISRAQGMDVLSSMSTIAGYKAALLAAERLPRFFPMLITAAGTLPPARVLILGAGVAGLQAIATCRRIGANVEAFDVRPAVKEQVESLGAKFVGLSLLSEQGEGAGGYAQELTKDTHERELELIASRLPHVDAVITTALIPNRPPPTLLTKEMLALLKPGSVVVDLAAPSGGNCEATVKGETVEVGGVTIVGRTDLVTSMGQDASRMYSKNMVSFLSVLIKDGALNLDMEDEIVKGTLVTHDGRVAHAPTQAALGGDA